MDVVKVKDSSINFQSSAGMEIRATLLRLTRHLVVFEVYSQGGGLRTSEVLTEFKIVLNDRPVYSGKAIVRSLIDTGVLLVCEALLEESWMDVDFAFGETALQEEFRSLIHEWQKTYKILPEYKVLAADMHSFLSELRLWVEQVELGVRASPSEDRLQLERRMGDEISESVFPFLDSLFEKFETLSAGLDPELRPVHCAYIRRLIHPLVLASPFAFRSVQKPLGYAGDYELVNMILGDPHAGGSLYAKVLNRWFIKQPPAEAHRNRIKYLTQKLLEETARTAAQGRPVKIFNLGCGPAQEVQDFLAHQDVSDRAHFTLLDFNDETLVHARAVLEGLKAQHRRATLLQFVKKSVAHILKGRARSNEGSTENKYDFIYCAGLLDYLPDTTCKQLSNIFYDMLAPGGLLVTTNVDFSNPIRHWLGDILDWHLIYRTGKQMLALSPDRADAELARIHADITGVNLFLEIRKPAS